jgi:hypothetical protein
MTRCGTDDGDRALTTLMHEEPPADGREGRSDVVSRARLVPARDLQQSRKRWRPWRKRPARARTGSQCAPFEPEQAPQMQERPHRDQGDERQCPTDSRGAIERARPSRVGGCLEADRLQTDCDEPRVEEALPGPNAPGQRAQLRPARHCHEGQRDGGERNGKAFLGAHPSRQPKRNRLALGGTCQRVRERQSRNESTASTA